MCAWPVFFATPSGFTVVVIVSLLNAGLLRARFGAVVAILLSMLLLVYLPIIAMYYAMGHAFESSDAPHLSPDEFGYRKAIVWEAAFMVSIWIPVWIRSRIDRRQPRVSEPDDRSRGFPVIPVEHGSEWEDRET